MGKAHGTFKGKHVPLVDAASTDILVDLKNLRPSSFLDVHLPPEWSYTGSRERYNVYKMKQREARRLVQKQSRRLMGGKLASGTRKRRLPPRALLHPDENKTKQP